MGQGYEAVPKAATLQFLFTKTEQPFRLRQGAEGNRAAEQPGFYRFWDFPKICKKPSRKISEKSKALRLRKKFLEQKRIDYYFR